MTAAASIALAISMTVSGGLNYHRGRRLPDTRDKWHGSRQTAGAYGPNGRILPPGPGYGWGFPNGNPDGYGWVDQSTTVPLGADRTPEYYFPRHFTLLPQQMFFPNYYNPFETRGQRYVAYSGCGGFHPFGGTPPASSSLPIHPYQDSASAKPAVEPPVFRGRVEAAPVPSGATGLIP